MDPADVIDVLDVACDAVRAALDQLDDWGASGLRAGQYRSDLSADAACLAVLEEAGYGWLSEESGVEHLDRDLVVIVDPVDGSTNASRHVPWFATSLCAVDADGPLAAVVVNQATGRRYRAVRGRGATVDGVALTRGGRPGPSACTDVADSVVGLSGLPPHHLGWRQFRALGALALDLCAVADGTLDGFVDCSPSAHGVWDYAGASLVCAEVGVVVIDAFGRDLLALDHGARRTPVAGATAQLTESLVRARRAATVSGDPGRA